MNGSFAESTIWFVYENKMLNETTRHANEWNIQRKKMNEGTHSKKERSWIAWLWFYFYQFDAWSVDETQNWNEMTNNYVWIASLSCKCSHLSGQLIAKYVLIVHYICHSTIFAKNRVPKHEMTISTTHSIRLGLARASGWFLCTPNSCSKCNSVERNWLAKGEKIDLRRRGLSQW